LLGFWDGYCSNQNNYYLYQNANNGKFYFIPWGTDSAFTNTSPIPPYQIRPRSVHAKAILPNRLYRKDETQKSYVATLMSFLDEHWQEEKMLAEFDRLEQLLKPHLLEDNREFDRVLSGYRRFIKNRRDQIMAEFKNGPPKLKSKEHTPVYFETNGTVEITFSTQWFDRDPKKVPGTGEVSVVLIVDGNEVELKDLGVYAKNDDRDKNNASIIVIGTRVSNGRTIIIGTGMQKNEFKPSASQANVGGILIQPGLFGMIGAKTRMMFGTVRLEKASMNKGDPVKGTMSLSVVEMKSGPVE
jgi:hypothetical protein